MRNLAIWVSEPYSKDEIFNPNSPYNRDDCLASFRSIKDEFERKGGTVHTYDIYLEQNLIPEIVMFLDIPSKPVKQILGRWDEKVIKWVILQECEVIKPNNWNIQAQNQFDKIFTWKTDIIDNKRYYLCNFSNIFPTSINNDLSKKEKLCTLIAGNKKSNHPLELYSKRVEAIRWFELNHPNDFDLYGVGWDNYKFGGSKPFRAINRLTWLTKLLSPKFPSYKGMVSVKKDTLEKYKFSICFENARDIKGYITEKIFDCFIAGCVPVYWGANNITDHIPKECFIDKREFGKYEDLYQFMNKMPNKQYLGYLRSIEEFLRSKHSYPFSIDFFAGKIVEAIIL